jgi:hypothetical protein
MNLVQMESPEMYLVPTQLVQIYLIKIDSVEMYLVLVKLLKISRRKMKIIKKRLLMIINDDDQAEQPLPKRKVLFNKKILVTKKKLANLCYLNIDPLKSDVAVTIHLQMMMMIMKK